MNPGTPPRRFGTLVLPLFLFIHLLISCVSAQEPFTIEWQEARLSVRAQAASFAALLSEIARLTGLEVRGLAWLPATVDVEFSRLPLHEGLKRLLAPVNSVIVEKPCCGGRTRPALVFIFGHREPSSVEAPPEERATAENEIAVTIVLDGEKEEPQEGPVADVVIYEQEEDKTQEGS